MAEMRSRNTEIARSGLGEFTDRICGKNFYTKTSQISNSRMQTYSFLLRQAGLAILVHPTDGSLPPTTARMVFGNQASCLARPMCILPVVLNHDSLEACRPRQPAGFSSDSCAPPRPALEVMRMGQQLRRRAKRKRRKAYLERKRAKQKSMRREPTRAKPKKSAASPSTVAPE